MVRGHKKFSKRGGKKTVMYFPAKINQGQPKKGGFRGGAGEVKKKRGLPPKYKGGPTKKEERERAMDDQV